MTRLHVATVLAVALLLAACGTGDAEVGQDEPATTAPSESTTTSCPPPPPDVVTTLPTSTTSVNPAVSTTIQAATTQPTTTHPTTTTSEAPEPRDLGPGDTGTDVAELQTHLLGFGYWLPAATGTYDDATYHAATAFEKANGLERNGVMSIDDQRLLAGSERPVPRSTTGRVIEVDIERQVLLVAQDGDVLWVLDTSTGARPGSTPVGSFTVYREIDGIRVSALGQLYRPKYVVGGVAIHGYPEVPSHPASHGCLRLTNDAMDAVWSLDLAPIGTPVLIYDD